jgi:hypothetical protein
MMYSKEEAKELRMEFWERFRNYSAIRRRQKGRPQKWMLDKTGIKALNLRFFIDRKTALVGIDIESPDMELRMGLYEKLESLKSLLEKSMNGKMTWELDYIRENGKSVSRVFVSLNDVDIYDRECWPSVYKFFYTNMMKLESFFMEYKDLLKYSSEP